jgi:heme/copper-type cytochrome/quinol oxidase subunit 2
MALNNKLLTEITNPVLKNSGSIASSPSGYVNNIIQSIVSIFMIVAVVYFIWHFVMAAYHMINSNGDPKKWEEAQKSILYSFVGVILVFSLFAILKFVGTVTGVPGLQTLKLTWPSL